MSSSHPRPPGSARQRLLDDLFGDEPYLSPTMKARRLNDASAAHYGEPPDADARRAPSTLGPSALDQAPVISEEETDALWRKRAEEDASGSGQSSGRASDSDSHSAPAPPLLKMVDTLAVAGNWRDEPPASEPANWNHGVAAFGSDTIPIEQAAALLRADLPAGAELAIMSPLRQFRAEVLSRWLHHLPKRERVGEEL